jgi:glutamate-1-semialdehyde 2,1-aminomutase
VITGFRFAMGGATERYRISPPPDLVAMAKMLGGGLPLGAVGGRRDVLAADVVAGNTHSINPVCVSAALAALGQLSPKVYERMCGLGQSLRESLRATFDELGLNIQVTGDATNVGIHLVAEEVRDAETARKADQGLFNLLRLGMLNRGMNWTTRGFGITAAFTESDVAETVANFRRTALDLRPLITEVAPELIA